MSRRSGLHRRPGRAIVLYMENNADIIRRRVAARENVRRAARALEDAALILFFGDAEDTADSLALEAIARDARQVFDGIEV
jgi:hypothetical protein